MCTRWCWSTWLWCISMNHRMPTYLPGCVRSPSQGLRSLDINGRFFNEKWIYSESVNGNLKLVAPWGIGNRSDRRHYFENNKYPIFSDCKPSSSLDENVLEYRLSWMQSVINLIVTFPSLWIILNFPPEHQLAKPMMRVDLTDSNKKWSWMSVLAVLCGLLHTI